MTAMQLQPATSYTLQTLNDIFVDSFQGYFVPIPNDLKMFAFRLRSEHIDLTESLVAEIDGQPAGISLTARRLGRTRLAGLGVCPEFRRHGIGTQLTRAFMQPALERQDEIVLECFQANIKALQLYQGNGFEVSRSLLGYSGTLEGQPDSTLQKIPLVEAVEFVRQHADSNLPWQISADTLISLPHTALAYRLQDSVAILSQAGELLYLRSLVTAPSARNQGQATALLRAIGAATGLSRFQAIPVFPETLIQPLAEKLGWERSDLCQYELVYRS